MNVLFLRYGKSRTGRRFVEVSVTNQQMENGKKDRGKYYSKEYKFNAILVQRLKDFLGMFNRNGGRGGQWSVEYQNTYNVVMPEVNGGDTRPEKLA